MIHELIGVPKTAYDVFLEGVVEVYASNPKYVKLKKVNESVRLTSTKVEKYLNSLLREPLGNRLEGFKYRYGAFSGKSIFSQVEGHKDFEYILRLDIHHFFESLSWSVVEKELQHIQTIDQQHMDLIKHTYFFRGYLSRGLMNSPVLSELYLIKLDNWLNGVFTSIFKSPDSFHYSRYYDDIFMSANTASDLEQLRNSVEEYLKNDGLKLNQNKTKIVRTKNTKILGLTFSDGEIYPPKRIKQLMHEYMHEYDDLPENELDDVYDKLSMCGTIKGQIHYVLNNSTKPPARYVQRLKYFNNELSRLQEERDRMKYQTDIGSRSDTSHML